MEGADLTMAELAALRFDHPNVGQRLCVLTTQMWASDSAHPNLAFCIVLTTQMWASDFAFKADNSCRGWMHYKF